MKRLVSATAAIAALGMIALAVPSTASAATASKPIVPANGSYLGAWVSATTQNGPTSVAALGSAIGRPLGFAHQYIGWRGIVPVAAMQQEAAQGTIPLVNWLCGATDAAVAAGQDDATIVNMATALKSVGSPIFLRWYWEMNLTGSENHADCNPGAPFRYVAAWQHIWTIFQRVGATNVAFVWCPGRTDIKLAPQYYPGNQYVDWIAVDGYADTSSTTFAQLVSPFYQAFVATGKPMMVAETAALYGVQATYLNAAAAALPTQFPAIKAFGYFDHNAAHGSWAFGYDGMAAFKTMAKSAYFNVPPQ
jgi:hypothetical protein